MKKIISIILLAVMAVLACLGLTACTEGGIKDGETGLLMIKESDKNYYTIYDYVPEDDADKLVIPSVAEDGIAIGRIKKGAFDGNKTIKEIVVPNSIEIIDGGAFGGMQKLEKITLPFIGKTAVADGIVGETESAVNKSVDGERNFGFIFGESSYNFGGEVKQNYNSSSSASYYLPITLKEVVLTPDAKDYTIPAYAFHGINTLRKITLNENVTRIGEFAFTNCLNLATVATLDGGAETVGLSANVTAIETAAFAGCHNLLDADETAGTGFKFNENNAVTKLGKEVFLGVGLKNVVLTNVEEIGEGCFRDSNVQKVTASAVTKIGASAFNGCLTFVSYNSTTDYSIDLTGVTVGGMAFANLNENETYNVLGTVSDAGNVFYNTNYGLLG